VQLQQQVCLKLGAQEPVDQPAIEVVNSVQQEAMEARARRTQAISRLMAALQPSKVQTVENEQGGTRTVFKGNVPGLVTPVGQVIETENVDNQKITTELSVAIQNVAKEIYEDEDQQAAYATYNQKMVDGIVGAGSNLKEMSLSQLIIYITADKEWNRYQASLQQAGAAISEAEMSFARKSAIDFQIRAVATGVDQAMEAASTE